MSTACLFLLSLWLLRVFVCQLKQIQLCCRVKMVLLLFWLVEFSFFFSVDFSFSSVNFSLFGWWNCFQCSKCWCCIFRHECDKLRHSSGNKKKSHFQRSTTMPMQFFLILCECASIVFFFSSSLFFLSILRFVFRRFFFILSNT